jgi:hypothetical protein
MPKSEPTTTFYHHTTPINSAVEDDRLGYYLEANNRHKMKGSLSILLLLTITALFLLTACLATAAAAEEQKEPLQVVFAGFGRFGTHSLAAALTRLGYKTAHGTDIVSNLLGSHKALGKALMDRNVHHILEETSKLGYNATLECHAPFWQEIMMAKQQQPSNNDIYAKYIFMIREFDPWYKSMVAMRESLSPLYRYPLRYLPWANAVFQFSTTLAATAFRVDEATSVELVVNTKSETSRMIHQRAHQVFVQQALQITSSSKNALLFHIQTDGYQELCDFLEIRDCPTTEDEPFPHLGSSSSFQATYMVFLTMEMILYCLPLFLLWIVMRLVVGVGRRGGSANIKTTKTS